MTNESGLGQSTAGGHAKPPEPPGPKPGVTAGTILIAALAIMLAIWLRRRLLSKRSATRPRVQGGERAPASRPIQETGDAMALDERNLGNLDQLLARGRPVTLRPFDPTPYRDRIPDSLDYLWRKAGVSNWAGNSFQLVDPATYAGLIDDLLAGNRFIARDEVVPYGLTAFGRMSLWHRRFGLINVDFPDARICYMDKPEAELDWQRQQYAILAGMPGKVVGDFYNLLEPSLRKFGPIAEGEMYGFVPALAMGGSEDIEHLQKLRAPEHLSLLSQLSPPRTYFYDSGEPDIYARYVPMD